MKKYFYTLLLGTILAGCTANDDLKNGGNKADNQLLGEGQTSYLSIRIQAPGGMFTRAGDDNYKEGSEIENYVNLVRFFFFNDDDGAAYIRKNPLFDTEKPQGEDNLQYFSYYDFYPTPYENANGDPSASESAGTVEKVLTTMLVLNLTDNEEYAPSQIVAVVNPSSNVLALTNPDLSTLTGTTMVADYLTGLTENNFVMSNSVYIATIENNGYKIVTQNIEDNLATTQPEAQANPLYVYVERAVARLDMTFNPTKYADPQKTTNNPAQFIPITLDDENKTVLYPTGFSFTSEDRDYSSDATSGTQEYDNEPIYAKFLGWAITSTPVESNLIKDITVNWGGSTNIFGSNSEPWYVSDYHRSFWAMNPASLIDNAEKYEWFSFNELSGLDEDVAQIGFPMPPVAQPGEPIPVVTKYMQENANPYESSIGGTGTMVAKNPAEPTKVIYAAQLCTNDGTPVTIADWNGVYFTLDGLKNYAATTLNMYYKDNQGKYVPIKGSQITFITNSDFKGSGPIFSSNNYRVYATLTTSTEEDDQNDPINNAAGQTWYHLTDNVNPGEATDADYTPIVPAGTSEDQALKTITNYMAEVFGHAMIWNEGYTYYYYTIRHLGNPENEKTPGHFGVVRNHIYNSTVNALSGLGTPVWDPEEDIYPEKPEHEGNNLSAVIKVLQWRLVTAEYELNW
ncbi:MAG: Mfa1 fimbrilin C-terminal domain-containing protein [Muribaculaceae bacterium]|nr:Mfa1 fimbrilin C-terminal domain-containing protein [Muribaculaceae bacterium]